VFFDYANLKRPIVFYMYDFEKYKSRLRDFYFDLELLPGPRVQHEKDLIEEIQNLDTYWDRYQLKYNEFRKMFNPFDSKECSKRIVEKIFRVNENESRCTVE
jgi:CDP-glycerol glycerophosphotransferase